MIFIQHSRRYRTYIIPAAKTFIRNCLGTGKILKGRFLYVIIFTKTYFDNQKINYNFTQNNLNDNPDF